jgi:hypothetical protein
VVKSIKLSEAHVVVEWAFGRETLASDELYCDSYDAAEEARRLNALHQASRYSACTLEEHMKDRTPP